MRSALIRVDPVVAAAIEQYEALLDKGSSEEAIRKFLATHVYFWNGLLRMGNQLYTKIRLGDEFEIDFLLCDPSSDGAEWHLIEIEAPTARLLTKRGDPSKELTHALRQVRQWQRWIERNRAYADELMPGIDHPMGHVFMGRRKELQSPKAREDLRAINMQNRAYVEVGTLDRFAEQAYSLITGGRTRHVAVTKTHRSLRTGLPSWLEEFARSPFGMDREFLKSRRRRTRFREDWPQHRDLPPEVFIIDPVAASRRASVKSFRPLKERPPVRGNKRKPRRPG